MFVVGIIITGPRCKYTQWELFDGHCYKAFGDPRPREAAKFRCSLYGGGLVIISSEEESDFVSSKCFEVPRSYYSFQNISKIVCPWFSASKALLLQFNRASDQELRVRGRVVAGFFAI